MRQAFNKGGAENSRARLRQLIDKEIIIKILDAATNLTGLTANIVDRDGKSIFSKKDAQNNCEFCQLIWKMEREKGISRCAEAYARAGKKLLYLMNLIYFGVQLV